MLDTGNFLIKVYDFLKTSTVVGAGIISFADMDTQVTTFRIKYLEDSD